MKKCQLAQTGCSFVSSFFILPSSFFGGHPRAGQRRDFPLGQKPGKRFKPRNTQNTRNLGGMSPRVPNSPVFNFSCSSCVSWLKNFCKPMSGKPTVATVPPRSPVRLAAMGKHANRPSTFNKARSLAASTCTTLASIKPALVSKQTFVASLTT